MGKNTCDFCGETSYMLFPCKNCGQSYCAIHRLPENHDCTGSIPSPRDYTPFGSTPGNAATYSQAALEQDSPGEYSWEPNITEFDGDPFDPSSGVVIKGVMLPKLKEPFHIAIAFAIMFFIGILTAMSIFSQLVLPSFTSVERAIFPYLLASISTGGFLTHEFSHRQVGRHYGLPARFRLLTFGMLLTAIGVGGYLMSSGTFPPFALPGAVVVIGLDNRDHAGKCKIAGPLSNFIISCIIFPVIFLIPPGNDEYRVLLLYGAYINTFLGVFNMLPVGLLDGANIFKWNKKYYFLLMAGLVAFLVTEFVFFYNTSLFLTIY
ncbi:hypothetical protein GF325_13890 [Candidatus Bathyarchaeota archaeon]|nr:hypothetical protein [Candidatus Bathyarchaeota archaeon]